MSSATRKPLDTARRSACARDFIKFCETYLPHRFTNAWGNDQAGVARDLESVVLIDGLQLYKILERARGATTLTIAAVLFAGAYRHRQFVVAATHTQAYADMMRDEVLHEIGMNEALAADFPEMHEQQDDSTAIVFKSIATSFHGLQDRSPDGTVHRPDLLIIDNPHNHESLSSPTERVRRDRAIANLLGSLAGPNKRIAGMVLQTTNQG